MAAREVETALDTCWGIEPQKAKLLARLSRGCLGWAVSAAVDDSLLQQRAEQLDKLVDIIHAGYEERFAYAAQLATQFGQNRELVQGILDLWLQFWRDLVLVKLGLGDIITNLNLEAMLVAMARGYSLAQIRTFINSLQAAEEQLKQNASPRLALEVLMLNIPRKERRGGENPTAQFLVKHG